MKNVLIIVISLLTISVLGQSVKSPSYSAMLQGLLQHNVNEVSVSEIDQINSDVVYLDAREKEEYAVSHIEGAKFIGYNNFNLKNVKDIPKDSEIIIYCSVGYRSEKITQQLKRKGFKNVSNLYGGLFEWSNCGKPMVNEDGSTENIHPYDEEWGKWITKGNKVYK